jgi:hypothetical protein
MATIQEFNKAINSLTKQLKQVARELAANKAVDNNADISAYIKINHQIQRCMDQYNDIQTKRHEFTADKQQALLNIKASQMPLNKYYRRVLDATKDVQLACVAENEPIFVKLVSEPKELTPKLQKSTPEPKELIHDAKIAKKRTPLEGKANIAREVLSASDFKFKTAEQCKSMKRAASTYMSKEAIIEVIRSKPHVLARMPQGYAKATKDVLCDAIFVGVSK